MSIIHTSFRFYIIVLFAALISVNLYAQERPVPEEYASWLDAVNTPYAWERGFTGQTAVVGIVDDSIDMSHPFYSSNIETYLAINTGAIYNGIYQQYLPNLPDQSPTDTSAFWDRAEIRSPGMQKPTTTYGDCHGTAVTGCVASYDAETKTYGSAYNATIVPIRLDFCCQSLDAEMPDGASYADYTTYQGLTYRNDVIDLKNNSYGISIGYAGTGSEVSIAAIADARANNTILLFAAGNERDDRFPPNNKDSGKKVNTAHPYTIAVAATKKDDFGDYTKYADFSNYGACVFICAPGVEIQTSDRVDVQTGNIFLYECELVSESNVQGYAEGDMLANFAGTSAACPVATGVVALAIDAYKQTYPDQICDARFIKHLLARTSTKLDLENEDRRVAWVTNKAELSFSPSYGFGQINAKGLIDAILDPETNLGGKFDTVTPQTFATVDWSTMEVSAAEKLIYSSTEMEIPEDDDDDNTGSAYLTTFSRTNNDALAAAVEYQSGGTAAYVTPNDFQKMEADPVLIQPPITITITDETFLNSGIIKQDLEEVVVTLTAAADDPSRGFDARNMEIILEHDGIQNYLVFGDRQAIRHYLESITWSFSINAFWGEDPTGDWTLYVYDRGSEPTEMYTVTDVYSAFYMGSLSSSHPEVPEPSTWALMGLGVVLLYMRKRVRS